MGGNPQTISAGETKDLVLYYTARIDLAFHVPETRFYQIGFVSSGTNSNVPYDWYYSLTVTDLSTGQTTTVDKIMECEEGKDYRITINVTSSGFKSDVYSFKVEAKDRQTQDLTIREGKTKDVYLFSPYQIDLLFHAETSQYYSFYKTSEDSSYGIYFDFLENGSDVLLEGSGRSSSGGFYGEAGKDYIIRIRVNTGYFTPNWRSFKLEGLGNQAELLSIQVNETKEILTLDTDHIDLSFTPEKSGVYQFYVTDGVNNVDQLVLSDGMTKKILKAVEKSYYSTADTMPPLIFSAEAGKPYILSVSGRNSRVVVRLEEYGSFEGTESFRLTKINGSDVPEEYSLYYPANTGSTYELTAKIPVWHLVEDENSISDTVYVTGACFSGDENIIVNTESGAASEGTDYTVNTGSGWPGLAYKLRFNPGFLYSLYSEDPNGMLTITVSGTLPESFDYLSEIEGYEGYPVWYENQVQNESELMATGFSFVLEYVMQRDNETVTHYAAIIPGSLTLAVIITNLEILESKGLMDSLTEDLTLTGSDGTAFTTCYNWDSGFYDGLVDGLDTLLGQFGNREYGVYVFRGLHPGQYTLRYTDPESSQVTVEKTITVSQSADYITGVNEAGFSMSVTDKGTGVTRNVPWENYGRLLSAVENENTSGFPTLPYGCLNGAVIGLEIPGADADCYMKIVSENGLVDAATAAYGDTVTFRTVAELDLSIGQYAPSFEYIFPDSVFEDNYSGSYEHIRPFDVKTSSITANLVTGDSSTGLQVVTDEDQAFELAENGTPALFMEIDENGINDGQMFKLYANLPESATGRAQLIIDIPAVLTGALSAGGYGNIARMNAVINNVLFEDANIVYTGTMILQKIDPSGNPLSGAVFKLEKIDDPDFTVASVRGMSMHFVPYSVIYGGDDASLVLVGHESTVVADGDGVEVDPATGALSFTGLDVGTYLLLETKAPSGYRALDLPVVIELTANIPENVVNGAEYCRWSVKLNEVRLPELVRYQMGLINPELPSDAYRDSFIAYSCQSSTIVLRTINVPNDMTVNIKWNGDENVSFLRPEKVDIMLKKNNASESSINIFAPKSVSANENGEWIYTYDKLPTAEDLWTVELMEFPHMDEYDVRYMPVRIEGDKQILDVVVSLKEFEYEYTNEHVTWKKGSDSTADFTIERSVNDHCTYGRFIKTLVDGKEVPASEYLATKGSLNLAFSSAYMETLSVGEHKLSTVFLDDEDVSTTFEVTEEKSEPDPDPNPDSEPEPEPEPQPGPSPEPAKHYTPEQQSDPEPAPSPESGPELQPAPDPQQPAQTPQQAEDAPSAERTGAQGYIGDEAERNNALEELESLSQPENNDSTRPAQDNNSGSYSLVVNYVFMNGTKAADSAVLTLSEGEAYNVLSPQIPGYNTLTPVISGTMSAQDRLVTVFYIPEGFGGTLVEITDLDTPLGLGSVYTAKGVCFE